MASSVATRGSVERFRSLGSWLPWTALVAILALTVGLRWRALDVPLERDEGEYAYAGRLILEGVPPYEQAYNMKLPGIYAAYAAVLAVFGQTTRGIHLGLLTVNLATIVLLFALAVRLFDGLAGAAAAASYATLSVGPEVQGAFANAEHFVLPLAIAGVLLVVIGVESDRLRVLAVGGLLLGGAAVVKQHGAVFVAAAAVYVFAATVRAPRGRRLTWTRLGVLGGSSVVPYLLACVVLWLAGSFDKFWFWTVRYAAAYTQRVPVTDAASALVSAATPVIGGASWLWVLALCGLAVACLDPEVRETRKVVLPFTAFSFAAILPGFLFRPHYFVLLLPAVALLVGACIRFVARRALARKPAAVGAGIAIALALAAVAQSLYVRREPLFGMTPVELSRYTYGSNPFPESPEIAEFVRANTGENDRVAILGSEPQILFYSGRRSATGYIYVYPLMEQQPYAVRMQQEMIREIEASEPAMILFVHVEHSWLRRPDSPTLIFDWLQRYRGAFRPVAAMEIRPGGSRFYSGRDLARFDPSSPNHIAVFRRRS